MLQNMTFYPDLLSMQQLVEKTELSVHGIVDNQAFL